MCGILGRVARLAGPTLAPALAAMRHRGPDASAEARFESAGRHVQFGHRRLSILDLSEAANQPFVSADGRYAIVFNGEIYNHAELRAELTRRGVSFRTRSDTEVLLAALALDWDRALCRLNGMFAFVALDLAGGRLLMARDTFGIKPLYYAWQPDEGLVFGSELRALAVARDRPLQPDLGDLPEFLLNGFLYEPRTGYVDLHKVPPGHAIEVSLADLSTRTIAFARATEAAPDGSSLEALIDEQLRLEVEADVPVGVFFSGGIDSSVLAAGAPRSVRAFFVDYGGEHPGESEHAAAVAAALGLSMLSARHVAHEAGVEDVLEDFRSVAEGTEEPISDYTYIATRLISRLAREAGFKVMLSGMGGDELFAGYPRHRAARHWAALHAVRGPLTLATKVMRRSEAWGKRADRLAAFAAAEDFVAAYTSLVGYFSMEEVSRLTGRAADLRRSQERLQELVEPVRGQSLLRQAMWLDRHGFLSHNLTVTDRASMAESIEVRVPLLGPTIDTRAASLPDDALLRGSVGKRPLRAYLARHLPEPLINRPKIGFNPPLDGRIRMLGEPTCRELLLSGPIAGVLDTAPIAAWIAEHYAGRRNHTYRLWQLIYLSLWLTAAGSTH